MNTDLNQALQLVGAAQEKIDPTEYPGLWKVLGDAFDEIDNEMEQLNERQLNKR
jgi:hypothetical protein